MKLVIGIATAVGMFIGASGGVSADAIWGGSDGWVSSEYADINAAPLPEFEPTFEDFASGELIWGGACNCWVLKTGPIPSYDY